MHDIMMDLFEWQWLTIEYMFSFDISFFKIALNNLKKIIRNFLGFKV